MSITYRIAKRTDLPFIVRVYNESVPSKKVTADLKPVTVRDKLRSFKQHSTKRPLWIVMNNDQPAGWISLESFYGRPAYHATVEISIYLDRRFRHRGLGTHTLKFVARQTKSLGIRTILAFVFSANGPSQRLFKSAGYRRYGHLPEVADMNGKWLDLDILGKRFER